MSNKMKDCEINKIQAKYPGLSREQIEYIWNLGYSEGQNDKVKEVDEFYNGRG